MNGLRSGLGRAAGRLPVVGIIAAAISSCWSGKQYAVGPFSYGTDSTGLRTAITTTYEVSQTPHGLVQIDGPATRVVAFGFLVWICDAGVQHTRALGLLALGDSVATIVPLTVADWRSGDFVVFTPVRAATLRVSTDGEFAAVPKTVSDTLHASQAIAPFCATQMDSLRSLPATKLGPTGV